MKCPACNKDLAEGVKFCTGCGHRFVVTPRTEGSVSASNTHAQPMARQPAQPPPRSKTSESATLTASRQYKKNNATILILIMVFIAGAYFLTSFFFIKTKEKKSISGLFENYSYGHRVTFPDGWFAEGDPTKSTLDGDLKAVFFRKTNKQN